MENAALFIKDLDNAIWGPWMLILLAGTGIYLMVKLDFLPLKRLKIALLTAFGGGEKKTGEKGVSSFAALTTELAATIGTGNIVGVSTAMVLGGPGALLWMILAGISGMAIKLVESTLAVKYRSFNDKGEPVGGPMYILRNAFPNKRAGKILGSLFAVFAVMASLGMGNMTQSNSIADAVRETFGVSAYKTGFVVTIVTILVVLGGIRSISRVTRIMVPFMGIFYIAGTFIVILLHLRELPGALTQIVQMAFCPEAAAGGVLGNMTVSVFDSVRFGISRGVFSNEAGLGVSGISAASASTDDPVRQGYISMTSVFLDTCVICSMTGLALAVSGVLGMVDETGQPVTGTALTIAAFRNTFGEAGACFVSICIVLFAFATIAGWAYQGEKAFEFLFPGAGKCMLYRFFYALTAYVGAVASLELVWDFSDICNGLLVIPNLCGVLVLSKKICKEIREYN